MSYQTEAAARPLQNRRCFTLNAGLVKWANSQTMLFWQFSPDNVYNAGGLLSSDLRRCLGFDGGFLFRGCCGKVGVDLGGFEWMNLMVVGV